MWEPSLGSSGWASAKLGSASGFSWLWTGAAATLVDRNPIFTFSGCKEVLTTSQHHKISLVIHLETLCNLWTLQNVTNTLGFCEHFDGCHTSPTPVNNWASEHHRSCVTPHEHLVTMVQYLSILTLMYPCIYIFTYPTIFIFMYPWEWHSWHQKWAIIRTSLNCSEQARNGGLKFTRKKRTRKLEDLQVFNCGWCCSPLFSAKYIWKKKVTEKCCILTNFIIIFFNFYFLFCSSTPLTPSSSLFFDKSSPLILNIFLMLHILVVVKIILMLQSFLTIQIQTGMITT